MERIQYTAALAVTGAWRGASRDRLYNELGWEELYYRRWLRRRCHFFNLRKNHQPDYLFAQIPSTREVSYSLKNSAEYHPGVSTTDRFSNSYFGNVLEECNKLTQNVRDSKTIGEFKNKLLKMMKPPKKSIFKIRDI
ncbi:MAG: hypothetical protein CMB97_01480 [Flavobacteriaceae bacterium]|nr:hypothetical protein [Flavobacteriaceae bacterium]